MKTVNVQLNVNEIGVLRGILFEYYQTLKQPYLCEEERVAHESLEELLANAEDEIYGK